MSSDAVTYRRFVGRVSLGDIDCYMAWGARGGRSEPDSDERSILGPGPVDDASYEFTNALAVHWASDRFLVRFDGTLTSHVGEVAAGVQAEFLVKELAMDDVPPTIEQRFINERAVPVLIPYLRQALSDMTNRTLGRSVIVPLIDPGQIAFTNPRTVEAAAPNE